MLLCCNLSIRIEKAETESTQFTETGRIVDPTQHAFPKSFWVNFDGSKVALKGSMGWLQCHSNGNVYGNIGGVNDWETFSYTQTLYEGTLYHHLKSAHGTYLAISDLYWNIHCSPRAFSLKYHSFVIIKQPDDKILISPKTVWQFFPRYCANEGNKVMCNRKEFGPSEIWEGPNTIAPYLALGFPNPFLKTFWRDSTGSKVALRNRFGYVNCDYDIIYNNIDKIEPRAEFTVEYNKATKKYGLKASNGMYLKVKDNLLLTCDAPAFDDTTEASHFDITNDGTNVFFSHNGKYCMGTGCNIVCSADKAMGYETYTP
jgi:hypothetical protein